MPELTAAPGRPLRAWRPGFLEAAGLTLPTRHLAASGGLLAATAGPYDVVRVGLALYGIVPDGLTRRRWPRPWPPACARSCRCGPGRFASPGWTAGTGVSYGPTFVTARRSRIATLPLGYADGYPRSLSNKAQVLVRGVRVPQVGTVAMDAIMVDVTDVPGTRSDRRRRVHAASGEQGGDSDRGARRWRGGATPSRTRSSPRCRDGYPGCTMRQPRRSACAQLPAMRVGAGEPLDGRPAKASAE